MGCKNRTKQQPYRSVLAFSYVHQQERKTRARTTQKVYMCLPLLPPLHHPTSQHVEHLPLLTLWSSVFKFPPTQEATLTSVGTSMTPSVQLRATSTACGSCVYFYLSTTLPCFLIFYSQNTVSKLGRCWTERWAPSINWFWSGHGARPQACICQPPSSVCLINLQEVFCPLLKTKWIFRGTQKAFTLSDTTFYMLLLSICIIKEQESFKACPLNTLAHPGLWKQAQAQHVNKINCSCDTH